jgi:pilus assembly protein CpaE
MAGNPRILVVDQDFENRAELQKGLVRSSFIVLGGVGYGAEALSLASELRPQVILVGVEEPAARPLQTIESLSEVLADSPIIAYSALSDAESVRRAVLAGARDYLTRPLKTEVVIKAIETALAQQERRTALRNGEPLPDARTGGMTVTIFGAKGGVGKTTIATNLATALVGLNAGSAVLVDLDTVFGDAAMMLDVPAESNIVDVSAQIEELDRESIGGSLVQHGSGVKVLPAPFEPVDWRNIRVDALEKTLTLLAQTHDFVIVDCPPTFTDLVAAALDQSTVVLLVTSLDITSVKGTATAMKLIQKGNTNGDKIKLTVNRATGVNGVGQEDVSKVLHREIFWSIPYDPQVGASAQVGTPVVMDRPSSEVSQSILELAAQLAGLQPLPGDATGNGHKARSNGGLLGRVFGRG